MAERYFRKGTIIRKGERRKAKGEIHPSSLLPSPFICAGICLLLLAGNGLAVVSGYLPAGTEIVELRTANARHYSNGDGTIRAEIDAATRFGQPPTDVIDSSFNCPHTGYAELMYVYGSLWTAVKYTGGYFYTGYYGDLYPDGWILERGWAEWNTGTIPDAATINRVIIQTQCAAKIGTVDSVRYYYMANKPSMTSDAVTLYNDAGDGNMYKKRLGSLVVAGPQRETLSSAANSDLKSLLPSDWFAVGYAGSGPAMYSTWEVQYNGYDIAFPPKLIVDYTSTLPHDVGVTRITAPTGMIDSTASITPACSVYNYGTSTETYPVRMRIGAAYNSTATVSGHAPGARLYVTFSPVAANWPRTATVVTCTTELTGDGNTANDRKQDSVKTNVKDIGVWLIETPTGTIDSGVSTPPRCTIYNYGTYYPPSQYYVVMRIGSFYAESSVVAAGPGVGQKLGVGFASYAQWPRGTHAVRCSVKYAADMNPVNDLKTESVDVRVLDAEALTINMPPGTMDSGTSVIPQATIRNNGSTTVTFNARFEIAGGYANTQPVTNLAAGFSRQVDFTSPWTAVRGGTFALKCTTMLGGDLVPPNNVKTDSVFVRYLDAGAVAIAAPAGTIDSGAVVTPACTVYNYGNQNATFTVRMKIGGAYNSTASVSGLAPTTRAYVAFPTWTALPRGNLAVSCSTELTTDMQRPNDKVTDSVTVGAHDVGTVSISAPSGAVDSGAIVTPSATVQNYGSAAATFDVKFDITPAYTSTKTVTSLAPGASTTVNFDPWTALARGTQAVKCSTRLASDMVTGNDKQAGSVTVAVRDAGTVSISAPSGTVDSGATVTPSATVQNYGTAAATFDVKFDITPAYTSTKTVTSLAPGASTTVSFDPWTALARGTQAVKCSTRLTGDLVTSNDKQTGSVTVGVHDVGATAIAAPAGTLDSGAVITPACSLCNYGTASESYTARMKIGAAYNNTVSVTGHSPLATIYVTFPNWAIQVPPSTYAVSCSTELAGDRVVANDKQTGSVTVIPPPSHDVGVTRLLAPSGILDSGVAVTPACSVYNYGSQTESFNVRMKIGAAYNLTVLVSGLTRTTRAYVTFPTWTALPRGNLAVSCSTELAGDGNPSDDKQTGMVTVMVHDVGAVAIDAPTGTIDTSAIVTPTARFRNFGTDPATFQTWFLIVDSLGGTIYQEAFQVASLAPNATTSHSYSNWAFPHPLGHYTTRCTTYLADDDNHANDALGGSFTVTAGAPHPTPGWYRMADVPLGPKSKRVKDGGCLAALNTTYTTDTTYVYAFKGNNRCEFFRYNISANAWATMESIPAVGRAGKKKAVKKGSALTEAGGKLYAAKGNNSLEFWEYTPAIPGATGIGTWQQKADVPTGAKNVKEGTGAATVQIGDTAFVYLLKGSGTNEFYRYNPTTNAWASMAGAPTGTSGKMYKNGSSITYNEENLIYALKGSYNEFFAYHCSTNTWSTLSLLPFVGSAGKKKKVKDGAGLAYSRSSDKSDAFGTSRVFALKGGNTTEFWSYQADSAKWAQMEDMPIGGGKRVKGGGALKAGDDVLWALKGNNTWEFYKYVPAAAYSLELTSHSPNQMANFQLATLDLRLTATPNPFTNATTIRYSLPRAGNVTLRLYDVTGKLARTLASGYHTAGTSSFIVPRSSLSSGIYMIELETGGMSLSQKLIVE
jgi:hypothetical protein